jgi:hypothetical protein
MKGIINPSFKKYNKIEYLKDDMWATGCVDFCVLESFFIMLLRQGNNSCIIVTCCRHITLPSLQEKKIANMVPEPLRD